MFNFQRRNFWKEKGVNKDIAPDEIFLDSSNLPEFDINQFEGRIEKSIPKKTIISLAIFFILIGLIFSGRIWFLQITSGEVLAKRSEDNNLRNILQFPERGIIYDRMGVELAWNIPNEEDSDIPKRIYIEEEGFSHLLGFINYPKKDSSGKYYEYDIEGIDGVEKYFNDEVGGENGIKIVEADVFGEILSESTVRHARNGDDLNLSIDWRVQNKLYKLIESVAKEANFQGGAGVIMDIESGELLAITNYPEFNSQIITNGDDEKIISEYNNDSRKPFLNRAVSGLYTPGSIIKPFIALAVLNENIISPDKKILSTGELIVPNPYDPEKETIFKDWKAHGWVDMREAIAYSSNVYFYTIGGGFEDQKGLGITKIEKYLKNFGFGKETGINLEGEGDGLVPNPRWKKEIFDDDWRVGDTYITSIGQFGFQITPIQAVKGTAFIANEGNLIEPTVLKKEFTEMKKERINIDREKFKVIEEGMRLAVTEGTAKPLNFPYVKIAAKTGTAEVGALKEFVNSWIIGYFPYEKPRYAFAVVMERRHSKNPVGGLFVMTNLIDWMHINTPEYLESSQ
jgi:penicillin-binding protein 2